MTSCVKEEYEISEENLNLEVTVFQEGVQIHLGYTEQLKIKDLLENFGGHLYAAGLTLREENLQAFCVRIEKAISGKIVPNMQVPVVDIDAKLNFSQITPKFLRILKQFQPFGPGNHAPVFRTV